MHTLTTVVLAAGLTALNVYAATGQMESKRAKQDVTADTHPDSEFWRDAPVTIAERDTTGAVVPGHRTEVRSRWTAGNLYFLFSCSYHTLHLKPNPRTDTETNKLWTWDVAEAFIGSDFHNIKRYKEFEVSPQGEWVDLDIDLDTPLPEGGWLWNSGFQAAGRIDQAGKVWYGFMRIPYSSIDTRSAAVGNTLRINLFRSQGAGPDHRAITWQPTHRPSYHTPEVFGVIRLVE